MLLNHAFGLFTQPSSEWQSISKEQASPGVLYIAYVSILALISPICAYISTTYFGWSVTEGTVIKLTAESALQLNLLTYAAILIGVFALGWMVDWMAKTYGAQQDQNAAKGIALVAYACTPLFLAGFALLYPVPLVNMICFLIAATYSGYLLLNGLPIVMNISKDQAFVYAGAILTVALVILVTTRVGTVILWSLGFSPVFTSS